MKIKYIDRNSKKIEEEKVLGDKSLRWLYEHPMGMGLLEMFFKKKFFSFIYGKVQDTKYSKRKINNFIKNFDIDMKDYKLNSGDYRTFNDFFIREINEGARPVEKDINRLISPADGKLLAYKNIDIQKILQIKGITYSLVELLDDEKLARKYDNGICIVIRLAPTDYHRFHFPDGGLAEQSKKIKGDFYSVNPIALQKVALLYCKNKREISLLKSDNFGDISLIEVGATCVGSIIQTYTPGEEIKKGDEKGYFKFGGSTVIMFLEEGRVILDEDLLVNSQNGLETKVKMGMGIASRIN
ncbi:phosphatidylserine decarboxylase [Desulfonispora thiosulfatigenes DSM 11270]|uniref:Phosphatidylserine decarboxylase proenzyme n=1 Tax=Desulfonispora thiosulfatigenes DSM 11270 TaxID=656914 RepID=A0A1W1VHS6_DESTI|nr:phosphatidylserine decarboxylase [Desulfonispora thiosulfatigenes]SMB92886.1 phosphatidylserine decarboxylase [Desulfonispora thiosulfatigenes DSM 11270]